MENKSIQELESEYRELQLKAQKTNEEIKKLKEIEKEKKIAEINENYSHVEKIKKCITEKFGIDKTSEDEDSAKIQETFIDCLFKDYKDRYNKEDLFLSFVTNNLLFPFRISKSNGIHVGSLDTVDGVEVFYTILLGKVGIYDPGIYLPYIVNSSNFGEYIYSFTLVHKFSKINDIEIFQNEFFDFISEKVTEYNKNLKNEIQRKQSVLESNARSIELIKTGLLTSE